MLIRNYNYNQYVWKQLVIMITVNISVLMDFVLACGIFLIKTREESCQLKSNEPNSYKDKDNLNSVLKNLFLCTRVSLTNQSSVQYLASYGTFERSWHVSPPATYSLRSTAYNRQTFYVTKLNSYSSFR